MMSNAHDSLATQKRSGSPPSSAETRPSASGRSPRRVAERDTRSFVIATDRERALQRAG